MKNQDIGQQAVNSVSDVHARSREIAENWVKEVDTHPHKPFNGSHVHNTARSGEDHGKA